MKRPTQVDVAKIAGVSRGTVSLVINDQADGKVQISEDTRARVLQVIEDLGYEPDVRAQALRGGDTKTIGLILIDMFNPHYWETAEGIEQEARKNGYNVLLFARSQDPEYIRRIFKDLSGKKIDGLIVSGGMFNAYPDARKALTRIKMHRLPVVELAENYPDYEIDCLVSDYRSVTVEAVSHLLSLGHRRIAMVNGVESPTLSNDRSVPFRQSLQSAGIADADAPIFVCGPTLEEGYQTALKVLSQPARPTALMAINDLLAIGIIRAASDLGLRIPWDLSLTSFDDIPLAKYMTPRLTTATKRNGERGHEAARMVLDRIQFPDHPYRAVYTPARLIIRESTGPVPA